MERKQFHLFALAQICGDKSRLAVERQASENSGPVPLREIVKQLYDAASSTTWRPGQRLATRALPISVTSSSHTPHIYRAIDRATKKSFVPAIKPLRRLFRNQGAVNDSIIEAVFELTRQAQEMIEAIGELQSRVSALEQEIRESRGGQITTDPPSE